MSADLGRLWPLHLMKQYKKEHKFTKSDIIEITHKRRKVKGVVLSRDEGWKLGCLDLEEVSEDVQQRVRTHKDNDTSTTESLDATWDAILKARQMQAMIEILIESSPIIIYNVRIHIES